MFIAVTTITEKGCPRNYKCMDRFQNYVSPLGTPESDERSVGQRGEAMLAKCANHSCAAKFLYLNKGALFSIEFGSVVPKSGLHAGMDRHFNYFWLCEQCCEIMILQVQGERVIAVERESVKKSAFSVITTHNAVAA